MKIEIVGVPFDKGGRTRGSSLGPTALRLAGLLPKLRDQGHDVQDRGDYHVPEIESPYDGFGDFEEGIAAYAFAQQHTAAALQANALPLILAGSHDVSIGTVSAALHHFGGDLAVLWIDAHADLNTPHTTPSGNLHGTPLAVLRGKPVGDEPFSETAVHQWKQLLDLSGPTYLQPNALSWLGLRSVDPGEVTGMKNSPGCLPMTMAEVDTHGVPALLDRFEAWMHHHGHQRLWVSFDLDSCDPQVAPGTGTVVRGGLTYREAHLIAEWLGKKHDFDLVGVDVVEVNPLLDHSNSTAVFATEWICSLFGKTILGGWNPTPVYPPSPENV